jgi:hypothetical protein
LVMSDRVVVMEQRHDPADWRSSHHLHAPHTFVANFIGLTNLMEGLLLGRSQLQTRCAAIAMPVFRPPGSHARLVEGTGTHPSWAFPLFHLVGTRRQNRRLELPPSPSTAIELNV